MTLVGKIGLRLLNMNSLRFYFSMLWVIRKILWQIMMIILSCNKLWRSFICSWFNINLNMMRLQACEFSVLIATKLSLVRDLKNGWYTPSQFFIKSVVFHHVGLSWIILKKDKCDFSVDKNFPCWCTGGLWYNTTICKNLHGPVFEYYFFTAQ